MDYKSQIDNTNAQIWTNYQQEKDLPQFVYQPTSISTITLNYPCKTVTLIQYCSLPSTMILSEYWPRQHLCQQSMIAFIAKEQSSGVGQKQNKWMSPPGNIYMTLLTRYPLAQLSQLSVRVNNAVVSIIKRYCPHSQVKSKWVNDVFVNSKKISGALIKNQIILSQVSSAVTQIGIGINVKNAPSFEFTYIEQHSQNHINLQSITNELITALVQSLFGKQSFQQCLQIYQQHLLYINEQVTIFNAQMTNKIYQGVFKGINQCGYALVQGSEGVKIISDGRMRNLLKQSHVALNIKEIMKEL